MERWIDELDGADFAAREQAAASLRVLDTLARPALEKKLEGRVSLELRKRVERLLAADLAPDEPRSIRAVEAQEAVGTADARGLLATLAEGGDGARPTEAAREALERLKRRAAPPEDSR